MDATPTTDGRAAEPTAPACFRHTGRETYIRCTRCERYICPDCMREAPVGYQCTECVQEGRRSVRPLRTIVGARVVTVPIVTYLLIALNVLAYVAELVLPGIIDQFANLGQSLVGPDGGHYRYTGPVLPDGFQPVGVAHGEWYRLITSAFLHLRPTEGMFGITHILFNMYWVWMLGRVLEEQFGRVRYLTVYLLSALGGSVLSYLVSPERASLGASGAVFGLVAAYFLLTRRLHHDPLGGGRMLATSLLWLVLSAGFTSWQGHLGGLLVGSAVGAAFVFAPRRGRVAVQAAGAVAVLALLVVLVAVKTSAILAATPWA